MLVFTAGLITPLSLAPFNYWWLGIISLAAFGYILHWQSNTQIPGKTFFTYAFIFGLGYYITGVHWIYISIHVFGSAPVPLAVFLLSIFIIFIALLFALPFCGLTLIKPQWRLLLGFPLAWVFSEWLRTWLLTGFPWLFIGYSHLNTPLVGWAPIGGVLLLGLWAAITSSTIAFMLQKIHWKYKLCSVLSVSCLWIAGHYLQGQSWTTLEEKEIRVGLVQPNIPQDLRWTDKYQTIIPERLHELSQSLWENDWVIWPEGVIHNTYHRSLDFINSSKQLAQEHNTTIISGVLYDELDDELLKTRYFNSVITIGNYEEGIYHKQRLVPFGEYVPLEEWIRGLITFFDLPFSVISSGKANQKNLHIGSYLISNAICYEITYPTLVAKQTRNADVLLTLSNDAWFGNSIGPLQHLQMARMRALETERYVIRGTNNGVTAIINPQGHITDRAPQFTETILEGSIYPAKGQTPFMQWLNYPLLALVSVVFLAISNIAALLTHIFKRKLFS